MSKCSRCGKEWPAGYDACPDDGTRLTAAPRTGISQPAAVAAPADGAGELQPGMMVGEYSVEGKLGEGGMGAVYSATHPLIGKKAAIKVISAALCTDTTAVERFVQEARSVNQIGHPNIVDVFAFGMLNDGRSYFVMEWLQGETLMERMQRGRIPLAQAIELLDQVCDALEAAHEKGIVHRDLKPDNVYLVAVRGNRQIVKLLDFGIAKLAGDGDVRVQKTRTGMMMGTPGYISPEQARGKNVDHRTDLYALGAMTFEIVLGRLPFEADNAMDIVLQHLTEPPPAPHSLWIDIPPALDTIILRLLEKDPAKRATLAELRAVLDELRSQVSGSGSFAPRLMTPATGVPVRPSTLQRPNTPLPAPAPAAAMVAATDTVNGEPLPAPKRGKGLVIALAALVIGGGAIAAVALGGGGHGKQAAPAQAVIDPQPSAPAANPTHLHPEPDMVDPTPEVKPEPPKPVAAAPRGQVIVDVNAPNAALALDGKPVTGTTLWLPDDREHVLTVTAPGRKPFSKKISAAPGTTITVEAQLDPLHGKAPTPKLPPPKPPVVDDHHVVKPPVDDHAVKPPVDDHHEEHHDGDYTVDPFAPKKK